VRTSYPTNFILFFIFFSLLLSSLICLCFLPSIVLTFFSHFLYYFHFLSPSKIHSFPFYFTFSVLFLHFFGPFFLLLSGFTYLGTLFICFYSFIPSLFLSLFRFLPFLQSIFPIAMYARHSFWLCFLT
jgi:hypothetical protein